MKHEKAVFEIILQVLHKPGYAASEDRMMLKICYEACTIHKAIPEVQWSCKRSPEICYILQGQMKPLGYLFSE